MKTTATIFKTMGLVAACGGGGGDEKKPTEARLVLNANCAGKFPDPAVGHLNAVEFSWQSPQVSLRPGESFTITLPQEGLYHLRFDTQRYYWDYNKFAAEGMTTEFSMNCGNI